MRQIEEQEIIVCDEKSERQEGGSVGRCGWWSMVVVNAFDVPARPLFYGSTGR